MIARRVMNDSGIPFTLIARFVVITKAAALFRHEPLFLTIVVIDEAFKSVEN